ncbi:polysaccharide biosynthesis/export family protein [Litoreibacter sp.]|nr:polysaccharide biosynthesis/export family protein [Litoreibacter sp.]
MFRLFLCVILGITTVALADEYRVKAGDTLRLEVMEDPDMGRSVLVLPDGTVSVPLAGHVQAAGKTVPEIEAMILAAIGPNYVKRPHLTVSVASLAKPKPQARLRATTSPRVVKRLEPVTPVITVFALGELAKPGKMTVTPGTTVLQLVAEVGGFTRFAAAKRLVLRRTDESGTLIAYRVNAKKMMAGSGQPVVLQAGDVIVVPPRKLFE